MLFHGVSWLTVFHCVSFVWGVALFKIDQQQGINCHADSVLAAGLRRESTRRRTYPLRFDPDRQAACQIRSIPRFP